MSPFAIAVSCIAYVLIGCCVTLVCALWYQADDRDFDFSEFLWDDLGAAIVIGWPVVIPIGLLVGFGLGLGAAGQWAGEKMRKGR